MAITLKKIEAWGEKKKAPKLIKAATTSKDAEIRAAALKALDGTTNEDVFNCLIASLNDPEPSVKIVAAQTLGNMCVYRASEHLRHVYETSNDEDVKKAAKEAFKKVCSNQAY